MKSKTILMLLVIAGLSVLVIYQTCMLFSCRIHAAFAREQIELFNSLETRGLAANQEGEILDLMQSIETYYPSGTKQVSGSALDEVVESVRRRTLSVLKRQHDSVIKHIAR